MRAAAWGAWAAGALLLAGCPRHSHVSPRGDGGPSVVVVDRAPAGHKGDDATVYVDEVEPNDVAAPQRIDPAKGIRGKLTAAGDAGAPDADVFQFEVARPGLGAPMPTRSARVELVGPPGLLHLWAGTSGSKGVTADPVADGARERLVIPNLCVVRGEQPAGDEGGASKVTIKVLRRRGTVAEAPYQLRVSLVPNDAREEEPNDDRAAANQAEAPSGLSGYYGRGHDEDWFRLGVRGGDAGVVEGGSVRLELTAVEGVAPGLRIADAAGKTIAEAQGGVGDELRLRNAPMGAWLVVRADKGFNVDEGWTLAVALEPPVAGAEREPNNTVATANPLDGASGSIAGFLWPGDADVYRFHADAPGFLRVEVTPPERVDARLDRLTAAGGSTLRADEGKAGKSERFEALPVSGDVLVRVTGRGRESAFDAPYTLAWTFTPGSGDAGATR